MVKDILFIRIWSLLVFILKFIPYEVNSGEINMQIDNDLLDYAIRDQLDYPIFRLYGWSPACVSLGRNQDDAFIDKDF